jgi:hypothetical protein
VLVAVLEVTVVEVTVVDVDVTEVVVLVTVVATHVSHSTGQFFRAPSRINTLAWLQIVASDPHCGCGSISALHDGVVVVVDESVVVVNVTVVEVSVWVVLDSVPVVVETVVLETVLLVEV